MKYIQKEYLHIYNKAVYILLISVHPLFAQEKQVLSCCGRNQSVAQRDTKCSFLSRESSNYRTSLMLIGIMMKYCVCIITVNKGDVGDNQFGH